MYLKTDVHGLVKDSNSGAVLNVDNRQLDAYKKQKYFMESKNKDTERLNRVENDLSQIKEMLQILLKENNK